MLGAELDKNIRTIPIPGGEVSLDGAELRSEATAEKEALITQLRENLEALVVKLKWKPKEMKLKK
jgi:hypothetical protein